LINKVFGQVDKMQSALQLVSETLPSAVVVLSDIREVAKHQEPKDTFTPFSFNDRLSLTDVSFGTKKNSILSGVTLSVRKGQSVGIIGPSGAGKTTLVDIILRLHRPFEGEVSIDGVTAESVSVSAWRRNIVYVPQESFIMNASVADNIRFFDPSITDRDVISALKRAHLMDLVESLPGGITAKVGEHGSGLSGGERQRLALARALARNPSILILDEATSALDAHAEAVIKETIKELSQSVTVIVIAHKPSTIDYVDTVIAMRDGRIIESGSPSELMERKDSYFRQIYEKGSELPTLL
jgi:ABC-type multidrug transport system fused ATPase/permease subunit